jgi:hypothetical protein
MMSNTRTPFYYFSALALALVPTLAQAQQAPENGSAETASAETSDASRSSPTRLEYRLADGTIVGEAADGSSGDEPAASLDPPCSARGLARADDTLYVACGEQGVYVYSLEDPRSPRKEGFREMGGSVDALFEARGRVWAEIVRTEARPITGAAAPSSVRTVRRDASDGADEASSGEQSQPEATSPRASASQQKTDASNTSGGGRPVGKVVELRKGKVVVDLGKTDGLGRGDKIELFRRESVDVGSESAAREVTDAVGEVDALSENRSVVDLGLNEKVAADRLARPTDRDVTADRLAPSRPSGQTALDVTARPLLPLGTLGFGIVGSASLRHSFEWPGTAEVQLDPMSIAFADDQAVFPGAISGSFSYDTTVFRLGLGAGVYKLSDRTITGYEPTSQRAAFDLSQIVRLGARDGLHLKVDNSFLVVDSTFQFGGLTGELQVPTSRLLENTWLIARGGSHAAGQGLGEIGLRVLTSGNGTSGSTFLTVTVGGAGVWGDREVDNCQSEETRDCLRSSGAFGPFAGFGFERRF